MVKIFRRNGLEIFLAVVLLLFFALLCWKSQKWNSVTVDEFAHLPAGYFYWQTKNFILYSENPPLVKLLSSLPLLWMKPKPKLEFYSYNLIQDSWLYGTDFMLKNTNHYLKIFERARAVIIFLGMVLGLLVYLFSRSHYGRLGGIFSLMVFVFCPSIMAHSQLATIDTGASLFIFLAVISLIFYLKSPGWKRAVLAGMGLGLAQLAKFSSLSLLTFYFLIPVLLIWPFKKDQFSVKKLLLRTSQALLILLIWIFLVSAGYRFQGMFKPVSVFRFESQALKKAQSIFRPLRAPFPKIYLYGLDWQMLDVEQGEFPSYFLGKWYEGIDKRYFLVAWLVKMPIPIQILFLLAVFSGLRLKSSRRKFSPEEILILCIMAWIFFIFSFKNALQIGFRYLLPILPMGYFMIGRLGRNWEGYSQRFKLAILVLFSWALVENLMIYPHYLSYFNEFTAGPRYGHKVLLDSNLDWGQDLPSLAKFMKENKIEKIELGYFGHVFPELYGVNYQILGDKPRLEYSAISAQFYYGAGEFRYPVFYYAPLHLLRYGIVPIEISAKLIMPYHQKKPIAHCGYSILVFKND